ncbi:MAG: L7Ae/L30e/S12e/Gadd45 family ribosomal protein [Acutalibacteraceae bacterium]
MSDKLAGRLGICRRSGHLAVGSDAVIGWLHTRKARMVLLAADVSPKTEKEIRFAGRENPVPIGRLPYGKEEVGRLLGLQKPVGVVATDDPGFARAFAKEANDSHKEEDAL